MLVSGGLNLSGIVSKGFDGWLTDKTVRDAEAMRSGVIAQWNLLTGIVTSPYPGIDTQHGGDPNAALQLLSHALMGVLLAEVNGCNAAGSAGAAAGGEVSAKLPIDALYPGYTYKVR